MTDNTKLRELAEDALKIETSSDNFCPRKQVNTLIEFRDSANPDKVIELLDTIEAQAKQIEELNLKLISSVGETQNALEKIEALQADAERLNYLNKTRSACVIPIGSNWYSRDSYLTPLKKRKTLREAIDSARKGNV